MNDEILFYDNYGEVGYDEQADHYFWRLNDQSIVEMYGFRTLEQAMSDYYEECEKYTIKI